ncbi:MAG TPA: diadenylate cyclase CdaA [Geobacteraceae bacterium]|nr:diadenylate cyclase CdaA [Geobacteraceae bacterium]
MSPFFRPQDIVDIIIMSFLVYQLYRWFKNTKALQIVIGLGFLVILYFVTKNLDLYMTSWILQELGTVLFILIIVIFQSEIRQALYRFSPLRNLFGRQANGFHLDLIELSRTVFAFAAERTGAIIVFQRKEPLDEYLLHGVPLDGLVSAQLLASIFSNGTPLHDGAVVIRDGRITQASCHLPLSVNPDIPQYYGTRHRAALGLSERSDAAVVIVSEERGEVTLALSGEMTKIDTPEHLSEKLHEVLLPSDQETVRVSLKEKVFSNFRPKLVTVFLVIISWFIITAKQGGILTVTAPIKFHNLPGNLVLVKSSPEEVEVQVKVISRLIPSPKQLDIVADVDLAKVREGTNHLAIKNDDLQLPLGVVVSGINPSVVKVTAERKVRKNLLVRAKTIGSLPDGLSLRKVKVSPASVMAEGPERVLGQIDSVSTEDIDLAGVRRSVALEKGLLQPAPQVKLLRDEAVKVQLVVSGH